MELANNLSEQIFVLDFVGQSNDTSVRLDELFYFERRHFRISTAYNFKILIF